MSYGTNYDTDILETRYEANKLFSRTGLQGTKKNPQKNFSILLSGTKVNAPATRKAAAAQRRPRAPQLLLEAQCTAPATRKAAATCFFFRPPHLALRSVHLYMPLFKAFGPCARLQFLALAQSYFPFPLPLPLGLFFCFLMRASLHGVSSSTGSSLGMPTVFGLAPLGPFAGAGSSGGWRSDELDSSSVWAPLSSFLWPAVELQLDPSRQVTKKNTAANCKLEKPSHANWNNCFQTGLAGLAGGKPLTEMKK